MASKLPEIAKWVQYFIEQKIEHSTYKSYMSGWNMYIKFCNEFKIDPLPVSEDKMLYYTAYRALDRKYGTVKNDLYALQYTSLCYGLPMDVDSWFNYKAMKRGIRNCFGGNSPDSRRPITWDIVANMINYMNFNLYDHVMLFTAMVLASCHLLRSSEFLAKNKTIKINKLDEASVKGLYISNLLPVLNDNGITKYYKLRLKATKTNRMEVQIIVGRGNYPLDPVYWIEKMFDLRLKLADRYPRMKLKLDSPLFLFDNGKPLSLWDMGKFVPAILSCMNYDANEFSSYSFRIGGATSLARRGVPSWIIQIMGRWASEAYKIYIRLPDENLAALTQSNQNKDIINDQIFLHSDLPKDQLVNSANKYSL